MNRGRKLSLIAAVFLLASCSSFRNLAPDQVRHRTGCATKFIAAGDLKVRVCDQGAGKPLVLLHGLSESLEIWEPWPALLNDYRIIRLDLPGFGLTGPRKDRDYTIETYAQTVSAVLDQLDVHEFALAGHSLGGYIAWYLAQAQPQRVQQLILIAPIGLEPRPTRVDRIPWPIRQLGRVVVLPRWLLKKSLRGEYGNPDALTDATVDRYFDFARVRGNRGALIDRLDTCWTDHTKLLDRIDAPTLLIWGGKDKLRGACSFDRWIRHSKLVCLPKRGHMLIEESPEDVAGAVKAFLRDPKTDFENCPEPCPPKELPAVHSRSF